MTTVYFVRHAQPNFNNHIDAQRELTDKGMLDSKLVTAFFENIQISHIYSSPFLRSVQTVADCAENKQLSITTLSDFQERKVTSGWIDNFEEFSQMQWDDFTYKLEDGESLSEVQQRNILALNQLLTQHSNENIIVASHGTALSTIINYYDPSFGYKEFKKIMNKMPWIVCFSFSNLDIVEIKTFDIL